MENKLSFEQLRKEGDLISTSYDGTCFLYEYMGCEYVVLPDNTIITAEEDKNSPEGSIFYYN